MLRAFLVVLLAAASLSPAVADGNDPIDHTTLLSQLMPAGITVNTTYIVKGVAHGNASGCTNGTLNNPCLIHVSNTNGDRLNISWAPNANFKLTYPVTATIKLCYSPVSSTGRAWRKFDDRIYHDKRCATTVGPAGKLAEGLNKTGSYSWKVPTKLATGTYNLRVYYVCDEGSAGRFWCAYGNTFGYFQGDPIQSVTDSLRSLVIGMCFVGPTLLAICYTGEKVMNARKRK